MLHFIWQLISTHENTSLKLSHSKKEPTANYMLEGVAHLVILSKIPKDNSMLKTLRNSTAYFQPSLTTLSKLL